MRSINLLKLFTIFGTTIFYSNKVRSAIPTCVDETVTSGNTTTTTCKNSATGYDYCLFSKKVIQYDLGTSSSSACDGTKVVDWDALKSGLYFIKKTGGVLGTSDTTDTDITAVDLEINENDDSITNISEREKIEKGYYLQANSVVVACKSSTKCAKFAPGTIAAALKGDKFVIDNEDNGLLKYDESDPEKVAEIKDGYYLNAGYDGTSSNALIKCEKSKCVTTNASEGYVYKDGSDENKIIICAKTDDGLICDSDNGENNTAYINYSEITKASKPLITCSGGKCEETALPADEIYTYYVDGLTPEKIISCQTSSNQCQEEDASDGDHYVSYKSESANEIIECTSDGTKVTCTSKEAQKSDGYYINSGNEASTNQTISCDSTNGCISVHVNPGYYYNNDSKEDAELIRCTLTECKTFSSSDTEVKCPSDTSTIKSTTICHNGSKLVLYESENLDKPLEYDQSDLYVYETVKKFPSITSDVTTLFKISKYGVERFIVSGVVIVNSSTNNLVSTQDIGSSDDDSSTLGTGTVIYDCSTTTKVCKKRLSCTNNTYMFDTQNNRAIFCNNGKLSSVSGAGNYVDGNTLSGTRTPYIIQCDSDDICTHVAPTIASYYKNSGYDSSTNALIYCSGTNCYTTYANTGYYVAEEQTGIIYCSSSSSCVMKEASSAGNNVNYVNSGANKYTNALIYCTKKSCYPKTAKNGYYFASKVTSLIYCESSNSCTEITPSVNYYYYADTSDNKNYIINCSKVSTSIICSKEIADTGSYLTSQSNVLITCTKSGTCKQITAKPGFYQSAVKITVNTKRDVSNIENESELVSDITGRDTTTTYNIIECTTTNCELLTAEELSTIPICEHNSGKCYITLAYAMSKSAVTSITAGNICTNSDRSKFYFATDNIVVAPNVIAGQTATYVYTTTTTNCLVADSKYDNYYYTIGSDIYHISDGTISHFYDSGYYFIDVEKNVLVNSNSIDNYNNENVKLYKCNGISCKILDKPDDVSYYSDVNKRIVKYNVNSDSYNFAYEKDITCIFANNKCTPNADLNNREFCITYKGELCLAAADIKNRETGDCFRASSVNNYIYGFNQYLYRMDVNSATIVDENGYYLVSLSTNNTISSKDYKNRMVSANSIRIYGCYNSNCKIYEPEAGVYYYDKNAKIMLKSENKAWSAPANSGYALVSVNPNEKYIYKFKTELDEVTLLGKAATGYYYTIDNEMYECNENDNTCSLIEESDYYFTNTGEIFYCVYDSENLEKTECTKQSCYAGQNYYINENYYRCEAGSYLTPIKSRNCKYDENVIVNFPVILKEEFPNNIKQAIESVEKNNNSTAIAVRSNKKYLAVVPAIYTNCTYNVEETEASYDFVCINNFVAVNDEDDTLEICSIENLGYVECVEDETNPEKCNPSGSLSRIVFNFFTLAFAVFTTLYFIF